MKQKYNYTLNGSFEDAHHDCEIVANSIHDEKSFQNADTGLVLGYMDRILEALEKQIPKKVKNMEKYPNCLCGQCPICSRKLLKFSYCTFCGQALDWGEENE